MGVVAKYSITPPDMSRNMALAGKTVSSNGMNVTYDENGFATCMVNYNHRLFQGSSKSVRAQSKDAVLNADARANFAGSEYDRQYFSDEQIAMVEELRREVSTGEISQSAADRLIESVRSQYGYSGGATGYEYIPLQYNKEPGQVYLEEQARRSTVTVNTAEGTAAAAAETLAAPSLEAVSASAEAAPVEETFAEERAAAPVEAAYVPLEAPGDATRTQIITALDMSSAPSPRASLARQMYQDRLIIQQQTQSLQDILREQRRQETIVAMSRDRLADRLLRLMDDEETREEEEKTEEITSGLPL